jgi:hypothetical protein
MSREWNALDLIIRLKKQYAAASTVQVGDIIVTQDDAWEVAEIHQNPNGFLSIMDKEGSGFMEISPVEVVVIVNRICYGQ